MQYQKKLKQFWKNPLMPRNKFMLNIWLETLNLKTTLRTDYVCSRAIQYSSVWIEESKEARWRRLPWELSQSETTLGRKGRGAPSATRAAAASHGTRSAARSSARSAEWLCTLGLVCSGVCTLHCTSTALSSGSSPRAQSLSSSTLTSTLHSGVCKYYI